MADRIVCFNKTFVMSFQDADGYENMSDDELITEALEGIDNLVMSETEYTEFNTLENFDAVWTMNAQADLDQIRSWALAELRERFIKEPVDAIKFVRDVGYVLTCNEFDLHDWVIGLNHTSDMTENYELVEEQVSLFNAVKLEPTGYKNEATGEHIIISDEQAKDLEDAANKLLAHISNFEALVHDICEYSC